MSIPDSLTLKKAMKIAAKIERLQQKLHELVGDTLELPPAIVIMKDQLLQVAQTPRRRGRPPGSGRKQLTDGTPSTSKLAGRPRPASPSGPLAPAVVRVLHRYNRPMKVTEILIALEQDNYIWTAKNPKQTLYVRIGKLAGVQKTGEGLYVAQGIALTGIMPEVVSTPSVDYATPAPVVPIATEEVAPATPAPVVPIATEEVALATPAPVVPIATEEAPATPAPVPSFGTDEAAPAAPTAY
jgi:hypothetical protein